MLKEPSHRLWFDPVLNETLSKYMGEMRDACIENISLIAQKLQAIDQQGDELDKVISPTTEVSDFFSPMGYDKFLLTFRPNRVGLSVTKLGERRSEGSSNSHSLRPILI
jgi:hypothetical protein